MELSLLQDHSLDKIDERIILALDFQTKDEVVNCLASLENQVRYVKVGLELFYAEGSAIVSLLKEQGLKVFVDLKIHDIPNTAKGSMKSLAKHGADMVNVHVAGGLAMMEAAREGLEQGISAGSTSPLLIGVTMLTSSSQQMMNEQILIPGRLEETVAHYASLASQAGLDGVVASPLEVPIIKQVTRTNFLTVTPGIRTVGSAFGDQTRVTTPVKAFELGTDYIVIGRSITQAEEPAKAWADMMKSIREGK
ncbi:orotidine 5'-phosphate decarboxylase [Brevibacillus halotolerans]|uniref:Orotidine 5'-phosphate decarboxylase n=1 Tax=Brevibacillus laterosporus TaxID=1465 RepID=A0A0F7EGY9_BRELA|nr:orotidine-5'-phosphate decarboxylase [Brevibacillus halotolerans]AKF94435.1 orotidine 5'-phosphate decarboxylase [Brevibacillus laterosporus]GIO00880.1 orotidine 5'-phosphate decarboxylase [Brevibacillus halotolerans]